VLSSDLEIATRLARETGALLHALRIESSLGGHALGDAGDEQANDFLLRELATYRPGDAVLSEESHDDRLRLNSTRLWIIDPLDGTREYREQRGDWAVHVALVDQGVVIAAAVAQPSRNEVFSSATTPTSALSKRVIVVSRSRPPAKAQAIAEAVDATLEPLGSAGVKALAVVRGEALAYVHEGGLNEWDAAAPIGVALAHGLHVSDLQGRAIVFNQHDVVLHGGLVLCRPECAAAILAITKT
jgi:3'(2'), 5'-bisphosphate nucleotidase